MLGGASDFELNCSATARPTAKGRGGAVLEQTLNQPVFGTHVLLLRCCNVSSASVPLQGTPLSWVH